MPRALTWIARNHWKTDLYARIRYIRLWRHKKTFRTLHSPGHLCPVCGEALAIDFREKIVDELAADWALTPTQRRWLNHREGAFCSKCRSSTRMRQTAKVLCELINLRYQTDLQALAEIAAPASGSWQHLTVAEISKAGPLHPILTHLPGLSYSEYAPGAPNVQREDLMALSYDDNSFDLVVNTEVLEHVPDYMRALREIRRILKPAGEAVITTPFLLDRRTRTRARLLPDGSVQHLLRPSYHGIYRERRDDLLVYHEFGWDFLAELLETFDTRLYPASGPGGILSTVLVCRRR